MIRVLAFICWIQLVVAFVPSFLNPKPGQGGERIVGGFPANITQYPHLVSIIKNSQHFCGGAILNERWILTAAHCTIGQSPSILKIRAGSTAVWYGGVVMNVRAIYLHPQQKSWADYDFSLLELAVPLKLSDSIQPIGLPAPADTFADGTLCDISGWGDTKNFLESKLSLRAAKVPVFNQEKCDTIYKGDVTDSMMCAGYANGGKDSCQGDSGGPMMCNGVLAGVVSWGNGCALANYPGVYSRVTSAVDWITQSIK